MSDITSGDAVKWLTNLRDDCGKYQDMWHYAEALDQIIELLSVGAAPRWIPCEERLPEPTQEVLVTGINGCVYTSRIVHGEFEYGGNVIAWMPLPEPYEGERRDDETD